MASKTTYGFDQSAGVPFLALHTFEATQDGQLAHLIDGKLRATVPPEGWADYVRTWPDAADIVATLTLAPPASSPDAGDASGA